MNVSPSVSLTFDGNCEAAFKHYESALGGKLEFVMRWGESPMEKDAPPGWEQKVLYARLKIGEFTISAGDVLSGEYVQPSGFHLMLSVVKAEGERLFINWLKVGASEFPCRRRSGRQLTVKLSIASAFPGKLIVNRTNEPFSLEKFVVAQLKDTSARYRKQLLS